jgi:hypothetical protein
MSAVTTQIYNLTITGNVPVALLDVYFINDLWQQSLGLELNSERLAKMNEAFAEGLSSQNLRLLSYNRGAATMVRKRQWIDYTSAVAKQQWVDSNIPVSTPISGPLSFETGGYNGTILFTHGSTVVDDDTELSATGLVTND